MNRSLEFAHRGNEYTVDFQHDVHQLPLQVQFRNKTRIIRGATKVTITDQFGLLLQGVAYLDVHDPFDPIIGERVALTRALAFVDRNVRSTIWARYNKALNEQTDTNVTLVLG